MMPKYDYGYETVPEPPNASNTNISAAPPRKTLGFGYDDDQGMRSLG